MFLKLNEIYDTFAVCKYLRIKSLQTNTYKTNYYCVFCACVICCKVGSDERVFRCRVATSGRIALTG